MLSGDEEFRKKFIQQELEVDWGWDYIKEALLDKIENMSFMDVDNFEDVRIFGVDGDIEVSNLKSDIQKYIEEVKKVLIL